VSGQDGGKAAGDTDPARKGGATQGPLHSPHCTTKAPLAFMMDLGSFRRAKVSFYLILLVRLLKTTVPNHLPKQLLHDKLLARDLRYSEPKPVSETPCPKGTQTRNSKHLQSPCSPDKLGLKEV